MTAQAHEKLILEGVETSMAFCPPLPEGDPRIMQRTTAEIKQDDYPPVIFSTGCWRNYIGTWEIKDGQFFLVDIVGRYKVANSEPILADWFSGVLRIPQGERLHYVHMGFGSVYAQELHIKIEQGQVSKSRMIDNRDQENNVWELGLKNLPGSENRFAGDDEL